MSTPLAEKLTHAADGLKRLLSKEKDAEVIRGILESYLNRVQELEDTVWLVLESRTLDGEGAQLDAIGRLVGALRGELDDDDYKIALRARIRMLRSSGRPLDLEDVARLSLPDGFTSEYEEAYPKTAIVTVSGAVDFTIDVLWRNLVRTKPGGTKLYLVYDDETTPWLFAEGDDEEDDQDHGEGNSDEDAAPGGFISDVIGS